MRTCYDGPQFPDTEVTQEKKETNAGISNGQVCTPDEIKMEVSCLMTLRRLSDWKSVSVLLSHSIYFHKHLVDLFVELQSL